MTPAPEAAGAATPSVLPTEEIEEFRKQLDYLMRVGARRAMIRADKFSALLAEIEAGRAGAERVRELETTLRLVATALPVLRYMCQTAGPGAGKTKLIEMLGWVADAMLSPNPDAAPILGAHARDAALEEAAGAIRAIFAESGDGIPFYNQALADAEEDVRALKFGGQAP